MFSLPYLMNALGLFLLGLFIFSVLGWFLFKDLIHDE